MVKFKRALSTLLVVAMVFALMPAFALAADGDITLTINKSYMVGAASGNANDLTLNAGLPYSIVNSKTTSRAIGGGSEEFVVHGSTSATVATPWTKVTGTYGQVTIKTNDATVIPAGNYAVSVDQKVLYSNGGLVYVYVEGKYVGMYDAYVSGINAEATAPIHVGYVALSDVEVADGVEIMYATAAMGGGTRNWLSMSDTIFSPVTSIPAYSTVELNVLDAGATEFPTALALNATTEFNAKVKLADGTYRHLNGYATDRSVDENNKITVVSSDASVLKVEQVNDFTDSTKMKTYAGEAAYKLTALADGDVDVTITATIGGVAQTPVVKHIKVGAGSVVEPEPEPEPTDGPVYLFFNSSNITLSGGANTATADADAGYSFIADETTSAAASTNSVRFIALGSATTGTSTTTWINYRDPDNASYDATNNYGQVAISTDKLEAASYKVSVPDYCINVAGKVYVYVGGKYVGLYTASNFTGTTAPSESSAYIDLGYVTLTEADVANGTKILGSSSARYCFEVQNFLAQPVVERGEVVSVYAECGVDEFNYGVHVGEILSEVAGARAISCKFNGRAERVGTKCELYTVRFENGVIGTYCTYLNGWRPFNVSIMTTKTSTCFKVDTPNLYIALLTRISETLKLGVSKMTDVENILNVTEFMLCGKKSRDSENGREVSISELCEDDAFDGTAFNEGYAANAGILYKD